MEYSLRLGWLLLVWLWLVSPAKAGFLYVFDQSNYSVGQGGKVDVKVFLQETTTGGTSLLNQEGLFAAGVRVRFDVSPLPGSPSKVLSLLDVHPNPAFDDQFGPI